jgi:hypothetical protein
MALGIGYEPKVTITVNGTEVPENVILQAANAIAAIGRANWKLARLVGAIDRDAEYWPTHISTGPKELCDCDDCTNPIR